MRVESATNRDTQAIAHILLGATRGKGTIKVCRQRAHLCVRRSFAANLEAFALVARDLNGVHGFLYAEERDAFDLVSDIRFLEVHYLLGKGCARPLLRSLRERTAMRIVIGCWNPLVRSPKGFRHLLEGLGFREIATVYQS